MLESKRPIPARPRGCSGRVPTALLSIIMSLGGIPAVAEELPFPALRPPPAPSLVRIDDQLALLDLIGSYSHLADGLHTDLWGELFTEDAVFTILPRRRDGEAGDPVVWRGRGEILAAIRPRHEAFRRDGEQRRHFFTNPIVRDQKETEARVAAYFQLVSSVAGGAPVLVGTGRYEGRVVKTVRGWRLAEWTVHSDQHALGPEMDAR